MLVSPGSRFPASRTNAVEMLTSSELDRVLRVLTDCSEDRYIPEFREHLLEALGRHFGFRTTTFFLGSTYSTVWTDPGPLQTGRALGMLEDYRNYWYKDDVFATSEALVSFKATRVSSISEMSRIPEGSVRFMTDYLAPADLRTATAIYLDVSETERGLVGIFGDEDHAKEKRDLAALRLLARPLNAISRGLRPEPSGKSVDPTDQLSARQSEVASLVAEGLTNASIARLLHLREDTVKKYVSVILTTLKCRSRTQLALLIKNSDVSRSEANRRRI
jgi:DNA-binding CsgD family transcriptional regulator